MPVLKPSPSTIIHRKTTTTHPLQAWTSLFATSASSPPSPTRFRQHIASLQSARLVHLTPPSSILEIWLALYIRSAKARARSPMWLEVLLDTDVLSPLDVFVFAKTWIANANLTVSVGSEGGRAVLLLLRCTNAAVSKRVEIDALLRFVSPLADLIGTYLAAQSTSFAFDASFGQLGVVLGRGVETLIARLEAARYFEKKDRSSGYFASLREVLGPLIDLLSSLDPVLASSILHVQQRYPDLESHNRPLGTTLAQSSLDTLALEQEVSSELIKPTRAGLFLYLCATLIGAPNFDDATFHEYLHNRYGSNTSNLVDGLITASFDVLKNTFSTNQNVDNISLIRSFVVNKLPLLLQSYKSAFTEPASIEHAIRNNIRQEIGLDTEPKDNFDPNSITGRIRETRQDFLFACALHELIPESAIQEVSGDVPMQSLPSSGKLDRRKLAASFVAKPDAAVQSVEQLERMDGNVGAVALAVVDQLHRLTTSKSTNALHDLANALCRRPQAVDVLLLFSQAHIVFGPLCDILGAWPVAEDSGDHQAVYEEYGGVLNFIFMVARRYGFTASDLGAASTNSVLRELLVADRAPINLEDLPETRRKHLQEWLKGLYYSDYIGDDLKSSCPPAEFHAIVATIVDQSIRACRSGLIPLEKVRENLEYLLEPFLLPALAVVLPQLARLLWLAKEKPLELNEIMPVLTLLIKPTRIPAQSTSLHPIIVSAHADLLLSPLRQIRKEQPKRQDVEPLLTFLQDRTSTFTNDAPPQTELFAWCTSVEGGAKMATARTVEALLEWTGAELGKQVEIPKYSSRMVRTAINTNGADALMTALIDKSIKLLNAESSKQQDQGALIDILTAIIIAPTRNTSSPNSQQHRTTLQQALATLYDQTIKLPPSDKLKAQFIVQLYRHVSSQLPQVIALPLPDTIPIVDLDPNAMVLDLDAATTLPDGAVQSIEPQVDAQLVNQNAPMDMQFNAMPGTGAGDTSNMPAFDFGDLDGFMDGFDPNNFNIDDAFADL